MATIRELCFIGVTITLFVKGLTFLGCVMLFIAVSYVMSSYKKTIQADSDRIDEKFKHLSPFARDCIKSMHGL